MLASETGAQTENCREAQVAQGSNPQAAFVDGVAPLAWPGVFTTSLL
jgi:hypothetical protein